MENFTPIPALVGGVLIGLAASLLLLLNGRVAGISSIFGGLLQRAPGERGWRLAFVGGLLAGGVALLALAPGVFPSEAPRHLGLLLLAGVLVGFGTRMSGGCTSGHGVCGLSRLSGRSLVAVLVFMATGAATVFALRVSLGGGA
jgi:uncharacterized protein